MFVINVDQYKIFLQSDRLPPFYQEFYKDHAQCIDEIDLDIPDKDPDDANIGFIAVQKDQEYKEYILVIALGYSPAEPVFTPGILVVPEEKTLFVGAGEKVHIYNLEKAQKILEDRVDLGFIFWEKVDDYVITSAETSITAFTVSGAKLWSQFLAPPWSYKLQGNTMRLIVNGKTFSFPMKAGPPDLKPEDVL